MNDTSFYKLLITYALGLLPYLYIREATLQLPLFTQQFYQWKIRENNHWKTHLFFKSMKIMNFLVRPMVYHLRLRGIMTYYWVCNSQKDMNKAIKYGACGIMTDDPPMLNQIIRQKYNKYYENFVQQSIVNQNNIQKQISQKKNE